MPSGRHRALRIGRAGLWTAVAEPRMGWRHRFGMQRSGAAPAHSAKSRLRRTQKAASTLRFAAAVHTGPPLHRDRRINQHALEAVLRTVTRSGGHLGSESRVYAAPRAGSFEVNLLRVRRRPSSPSRCSVAQIAIRMLASTPSRQSERPLLSCHPERSGAKRNGVEGSVAASGVRGVRKSKRFFDSAALRSE